MPKDFTVIDVEIPDGYGPREREAIASDIIDKIVERTLDGKDKNGRKFAPYSKGYSESLDFKVAGKTKTVNLQLSGDMLASLELVRHQKGLLRIGYSGSKSDNIEKAKAEGNILGTYGQKTPIPGKARDFLGLPKTAIDSIVKEYPLKNKEELAAKVEQTEKTISLAEQVVEAIRLKKNEK